MTEETPNQITEWLVEWGQGNRLALDQLMPLVYDELRRLAHRYMRSQRCCANYPAGNEKASSPS